MKFDVLADSREQRGWNFPPSGSCDGTTTTTLKTGDYTLRGLEDRFVLERKGSTGEFAQNVLQKRFTRELERLDTFPLPFLICEFTVADILRYPINSGIPQCKWKYLRTTGEFLLKRTLEIQVQYKTRFIFAGTDGWHVAWSLFKRVNEYAQG